MATEQHGDFEMTEAPTSAAEYLEAGLQHEMTRIRMMHAEYQRFAQEPPSLGSQAASDLEDPSVTFAYDVANLQLAASLDHLMTLALVVDGERFPAFGLMTLLRTSLEAALAATWLLEPNDVAARRARGFAAMWVNYDEQRKFHASVSDHDAEDHQSALLNEAEDFGLTTTDDRDRRRLTLRAPTSIELTRLYPKPDGCAWLYRYLSGYSHGKPWALRVGMEREELRDLGNDIFALPVAAPGLHLLGATQRTVDVAGNALHRTGHLYEAGSQRADS